MIKYYANTNPIEAPIMLQFVGDQIVDNVKEYGEYFGKNDDGVFVSAREVSYNSIWGQVGKLCLLSQHPARQT